MQLPNHEVSKYLKISFGNFIDCKLRPFVSTGRRRAHVILNDENLLHNVVYGEPFGVNWRRFASMILDGRSAESNKLTPQ